MATATATSTAKKAAPSAWRRVTRRPSALRAAGFALGPPGGSCLLRHAFAEDARGPEDQERHQHQERDPVLVRDGHVRSAEGLDPPQREPADDGALDVTEAADDGR